MVTKIQGQTIRGSALGEGIVAKGFILVFFAQWAQSKDMSNTIMVIDIHFLQKKNFLQKFGKRECGIQRVL